MVKIINSILFNNSILLHLQRTKVRSEGEANRSVALESEAEDFAKTTVAVAYPDEANQSDFGEPKRTHMIITYRSEP